MSTTLETLHPSLHLPFEAMAAFCEKWKIVRLEIFGSALREDFRPESDVDFLYVFAPDARVSLWELPTIEEELSRLVGREVDLISRNGIERSENWLRRKEILGLTCLVYDAGTA